MENIREIFFICRELARKSCNSFNVAVGLLTASLTSFLFLSFNQLG